MQPLSSKVEKLCYHKDVRNDSRHENKRCINQIKSVSLDKMKQAVHKPIYNYTALLHKEVIKMALRDSKRQQKHYSELQMLPEGRYEGRIIKTTSSETEDNLTEFLNIYVAIQYGKSEITLRKSFVKNIGRNFDLISLVQDAGLLTRGRKVCYQDLEGMKVSFNLRLYGNKPNLSDFEIVQDVDEDESGEEDEIDDNLEFDDDDLEFDEE